MALAPSPKDRDTADHGARCHHNRSDVMHFTKLTEVQRKVKRWRLQRNHIVSDLMAKDRFLTAEQANKIAKRMLRSKGKGIR